MSLEQTLAAVLEAEVERRVAAVQAAADAAVEAFRRAAEAIARGVSYPSSQNAPIAPASPVVPFPAIPQVAPEPTSVTPAVASDEQFIPTGVHVLDSSATADNMNPWK